jgi:formate hydrogenlyase subunit 3/multisubunit Na+/H+ antiporter MnhD subunit
VLGALAVLGVPPTAGYAARWRLYAAAAQAGPLYLALLLLATSLALLAYTRVIARYWWGPGEDRAPAEAEAGDQRREPLGLRLAILGLSLALLLAGLWPALLSGSF